MAVEGSSAGKGPRPRWLDNASDIRFIDYSAQGDDTLLYLEAPCPGEAAHEIYEQRELWPTKPAPEDTAVDLFRTVVDEVKAANPESLWYDTRLLKRLTRLGNVFSDRLRPLWLPERRNVHPAPSARDQHVIQNAAKLSDRTPPPQQARVGAQYDSPQYPNQPITKSTNHQMPQGPASAVVHSSSTHVSEARPASREALRTWQAGDAAFFGTWPGDETRAGLAAMLAEVRRRPAFHP